MRRALGTVVCLAVLWATPALSQDVVLRLKPSQTIVMIGSPFEITGEAVLSPGHALRPPESEVEKGSFEILEVRFGAPAREGDRKIVPILIRAAVFQLGTQTLPALSWKIIRPDGTTGTAKSPPVTVTVAPPKAGDTDIGDIRPIRGPYTPAWWPWIVLALAVAAGLVALYYYTRRKKAGAAPTLSLEPEDKRTFEEIALSEIDALPGLGLSSKEFYDRLSDIVRLYLERRCKLPALQMTSHDLLRRMVQANLDARVRTKMKDLLKPCDLAKFARHQPDEFQARNDCRTAKEIICILSPEKPKKEERGNRAETTRDLARKPK